MDPIHYTTNMFYLTLPRKKLPKIMELDGTWEIGLAEIQYKEAWLKVHFYRESELQKQLVLLPDGYSSSAKRIIKAIDGKKQGRYGHGRTPRTTSYKRTCQAKKDQTSAD